MKFKILFNHLDVVLVKILIYQNYDMKKLYLMTDADVDGSHIATLLITFIYKYMRPIIDNNRLFLAMPPLFKIQHKR